MFTTSRQFAFCAWVRSRNAGAATPTKCGKDCTARQRRSLGIALPKSAGAEAHDAALLAPIIHGDTAAQPARGSAALAKSALVRPGGRERVRAEAKPILGAADKARHATLAAATRRRARAAIEE